MRAPLLFALLGMTSSLLQTACTDPAPECATGDECFAENEDLFNAAYDENQTDPKADAYDCSGVRVPDRNGFNKKIALTFDDGPNPLTTPRIIATLKKHHAPATFFNNGIRYGTAGAKPIAAQIAADPDYILANHTQSHIDLAKQTAAKVADEIGRTDALIRAAGEPPKYLRFPFGSASCAAKQYAEGLGYTVVGWHIDSADWCYAAGGGYCKPATFQYVPDELRADYKGYVMSQVRHTNGGIILMHDIHGFTADHLDEVLTTLEAEGFSFTRLDDVATFPKLNGRAPIAQKFIGDKCTTNADCAFSADGAAGRCHPAGFCTTTCAGGCPDAAGKAGTFCMADRSTTNAGICVSKPATQNANCTALTGTALRVEARWIGTSTAPAATANVCAPR